MSKQSIDQSMIANNRQQLDDAFCRSVKLYNDLDEVSMHIASYINCYTSSNKLEDRVMREFKDAFNLVNDLCLKMKFIKCYSSEGFNPEIDLSLLNY